MAHWHVQNFEEEKIKGTLPRRSSTLFIHHVMVITCLSQRQEENDPFGTWIPQSCHGDDDLFQQATCRLLASHHRKLWVRVDAYTRETCGGDRDSLSKPIVRLGNLDKRSPTSVNTTKHAVAFLLCVRRVTFHPFDSPDSQY